MDKIVQNLRDHREGNVTLRFWTGEEQLLIIKLSVWFKRELETEQQRNKPRNERFDWKSSKVERKRAFFQWRPVQRDRYQRRISVIEVAFGNRTRRGDKRHERCVRRESALPVMDTFRSRWKRKMTGPRVGETEESEEAGNESCETPGVLG